MAVNPKEKKALQSMWEKASAPASADIPDGEYEFVILTAKPHVTNGGKPQIKMRMRIVGGNESFVGTEIDQVQNLETQENMGYFKKMLARLRVDLPESIEDVLSEDGVAASLVGKKFAGTAKTKGEFVNVYVNRLLGEMTADELEQGGESAAEETPAEETAEEPASEGGIAVGSAVTFTSKVDGDLEGEVRELLEEEGVEKARVYVESTNKVYKIGVEKLTPKEADTEETPAEEETEETTEEAEGETSNGFPSVKQLTGMKLPDLKQALADAEFDIKKIAQPREFAVGLSGLLHDKKFLPQVTQLATLCAQLGLKYNKGAKPAIVVGELRKKALARFA